MVQSLNSPKRRYSVTLLDSDFPYGRIWVPVTIRAQPSRDRQERFATI
jgi:hypothetical protein